MTYKKLLFDILISTLIISLLLIIFELIFFFKIINKNMNNATLKISNDMPYYNINLTNELEKNNNYNNLDSKNKEHVLIFFKTIISNSLRNLVDKKNQFIKKDKKIRLIVLLFIILFFIVITIFLSILLRKYINWKKIILFEAITFVLIALCEIIFYFEIFSKFSEGNVYQTQIDIITLLKKYLST